MRLSFELKTALKKTQTSHVLYPSHKEGSSGQQMREMALLLQKCGLLKLMPEPSAGYNIFLNSDCKPF